MSSHPSIEELLDGQQGAHAAGCAHCALLLSVAGELAQGHLSALRSPDSSAECLTAETFAALESDRLTAAARAAALEHLEGCRDCVQILHDSLEIAAELEQEAVPVILEEARAAPPKDRAGWRALLSRFAVNEGSAAVQQIWSAVAEWGSAYREARFGLLPLLRWWGSPPAQLTASPAGSEGSALSYRVDNLPLLVDTAPESCSVEIRWDAGGRVMLNIDAIPAGTHATIRGVVTLLMDGAEALREECRFELDGTGARDYDTHPWPALLRRFPVGAVPSTLAMSWSFLDIDFVRER
jgi:hypothetical protein